MTDDGDLRAYLDRMLSTLPDALLDSDAALDLIVQEACRRTVIAVGHLHNARHFVAQVDDSFRETEPADARAQTLHRGIVQAEQQLKTALKAYGVNLPVCPLDDPAYAPTFADVAPTPQAPRPTHLAVVRDTVGEGEE